MPEREEVSEEAIRRVLEEEEEFRRMRRERADWDFIGRQPPRVRAALEYYVETGDIRTSSRIAGLSLCEFRSLLRRARIPVVT